MTTKFGTEIVLRKAQVSAKCYCPTSTVTLFSEYGELRIRFSPVTESPKRPDNSGGTIVIRQNRKAKLLSMKDTPVRV